MDERLPEIYRLSERKRLILKAIVDAYIRFGEPVGSKYLAENQQLACSSATIRNEMAELEEMGFLEQPHTSAGRVPSELGYRFYVNSLLQQYSMTAGEIEAINRSLQAKLAEMDQLLAEATRIAAATTNYTGISVKSRPGRVTVTRFECMQIDPRQFVLVMLLSTSNAVTRTVRTPLPLTAEELSHLVALLNERLCGIPAEEFTLPLTYELERALGRFAILVAPLIRQIYEAMAEADGPHTAVEGVTHLLQYPEYADLDELRSLLRVLEDRDELRSLVSLDEEGDGGDVKVFIGSENSDKVMENSALIYRTIRRSGRVVGAIGVIGPRRMDYSKAIAVINQLAHRIDEMLGDGGTGDTGNLLKG